MKIRHLILVLTLGLLVIGNVVWFTLYRAWRAQANDLGAQNERLQKAVAMERATSEEFRHNVQSALDTQTLCGVYQLDNLNYHQLQTLDLRTDGTAMFDRGVSGTGIKSTWQTAGAKIQVPHLGTFRPENGDLIDDHGNRWLHIR